MSGCRAAPSAPAPRPTRPLRARSPQRRAKAPCRPSQPIVPRLTGFPRRSSGRANGMTATTDSDRLRPAEVSNFEIVTEFFNRAAERLDLDEPLRAMLGSSYRELQVQVPLRRDDGSVDVFFGYRVQHNGARGP